MAVRSSVPGGYGVASGTSMAAPHQSGTVALLWSAAPELVGDLLLTRELLASTAVDAPDLSCGGTESDNNVYGEGYLNAFGVVAAAPRGRTGALAGTVTGPHGLPVLAAQVQVPVGDATRVAAPDEDGRYRMNGLPTGTYQVTASGFGHHSATRPAEIVEGEVTLLDFPLEPLPSGAVEGTVTDAVSGHTVPGVRVEILDVPADLSAVTGEAGGFRLADVPAGSYRARVFSVRHAVVEVPLEIIADETAQVDLALDPLGGVELVTVSSDGVEANQHSPHAAVSDDGRYIAFHSTATNLVVEPPATGAGIYLRDRFTGETELITPVSEFTPGVAISADGRYIAYFNDAADRFAGIPDPAGVYVFDRETRERELVSVNADGEPADPPGLDPAISADGRFVAFESRATNLVDQDTYGITQVYVHDRQTGATELVSVNSDGVAGGPQGQGRQTGNSVQPVISGDGRYVAFNSFALNLVKQELPWEPPEWARSFPIRHVFVHDRQTGATEWASVHGPPEQPGDALPGGLVWSINDDGRYLGYTSTLNLSSGFGTRDQHIDEVLASCLLVCGFVYDRQTEVVEQLDQFPQDPPDSAYFSGFPAVSGDGQLVGFTSFGLALTGETVDESTGIFVRDRASGQTESVVRTYDGSGWDPLTAPIMVTMSGNGRYVLMDGQNSRLVPGTTSGVFLADREFDPDQPHARFVAWDLTVAPGQVLTGDPAEVSVQLKNVGNATGAEPAVLLVDGVPEASEEVSLAPGETTRLSWPVSRDEPGSYRIQIGHLNAELVVRDRAPVADLNPDALTLTTPSGQTRTAQLTIGNAGFDRPLEWRLTEDPGGADAATGSLAQPSGAVTLPESGARPEPAAAGMDLEVTEADRAAAYPLVAPDEGTTITHSASLDITHRAACANTSDGTTAAQQVLRTFTLADFGLGAGFGVTEVAFGVGAASEPTRISVNLYTLEGEFRYRNLTLIGTATEQLPAQAKSLVTVPVDGRAPAGSTLVVEVAAPDLLGRSEFRYGLNQLGETAPSYFAATPCGLPEPTPFSDLADDPFHMVMTVTGVPVDLTLPEWLEVDPSTGTVPARSSQPVSVTVDAAGLAPGVYTANLGFASNAPDTPLAVVPVTVEVLDACPDGFSPEENIAFGDQDSGVPNYDRGDGCTFLDLVWAQAPFANHAVLVRTARALSSQFREDGLFTAREATAVLVAAARSDVARGIVLRPGMNTVL